MILDPVQLDIYRAAFKNSDPRKSPTTHIGSGTDICLSKTLCGIGFGLAGHNPAA